MMKIFLLALIFVMAVAKPNLSMHIPSYTRKGYGGVLRQSYIGFLEGFYAHAVSEECMNISMMDERSALVLETVRKIFQTTPLINVSFKELNAAAQPIASLVYHFSILAQFDLWSQMPSTSLNI